MYPCYNTQVIPAPLSRVQFPSPMFNVEDSNFWTAIMFAEIFLRRRLRETFVLRNMMERIPTVIPWRNVIAIIDPGTCDGHPYSAEMAFDNCIRTQGINHMADPSFLRSLYVNKSDENRAPHLFLIDASVSPTMATRGKSARELRQDGCSYLSLANYLWAFGLMLERSVYLDPKTLTLFPYDFIQGDTVVASGWESHPEVRRVSIESVGSDEVDELKTVGPRDVFEIPLKT